MGHVDTLNLIQDSLLRRMRTMHSLYYQAVGTMDLHSRPGLGGVGRHDVLSNRRHQHHPIDPANREPQRSNRWTSC